MMKLNGQNIISDEDIDITNGNLIGEKLSDILEKQQDDIEKLKSNVKWLYKYGGVGSGSGNGGNGGGTSALSWSIHSTLDNIQIKNDKTIDLTKGENNYSFSIQINQPQGATFNVTVYFNYKNTLGEIKQTSRVIKLSSDNGYRETTELPLNCNGTITIEAVNNVYGDLKSINAKYIIDSYKTECTLVDNDNSTVTYQNNEVFIGIANYEGIKLRYDYNIVVPGNYTLTISYLTRSTTNFSILDNENINVGTGGAINTIFIDLLGENSIVNNNNLGFISINAVLRKEGSTEKISENNLSFTLISDSLYLSVIPEGGNIYNNPDIFTEDDDNIYDFSPGSIIFNLRPYLNFTATGYCSLTYSYYKYNDENNNSSSNENLTISFGEITKLPLYIPSGGIYCIKFRISYIDNYYPANNDFIEYYFRIKEPKVVLDWFSESIINKNNNNITRNFWTPDKDDSSRTITSLGNKIYLNTTNKTQETISIPNYPSVSGTDRVDSIITIGLQYSEVNDIANPLFICESYESANKVRTEIYQNKIQITIDGVSHDIEYFLPKERDFKEESSNNYHLLNIVSQFKYRNNNKNYYEILIYVDGIIEGALMNLTNSINKVDTFTIKNFNGFINLLDITYIVRGNNSALEEDIVIYNNFLCYYIKFLHPEDDEIFKESDRYKILEELVSSQEIASYKYIDTRNDGVNCSLSFIENIARKVNIPTILLVGNNDESRNFTRALTNKKYEETDSTTPYNTVSVWWCNGKHSNLRQVNIPEDYTNCSFRIEVQGSSTKNYKCKNWEFSLINNDESSQYDILFSPNYSNNDNNTFLPEKSFTLKADVVDSSHSNNTSIGSFVNRVTKKFDIEENNDKYSNYVKNCLEGFPCLVFLGYKNSDEETDYFYEGVYNFNLGRSSHHNLGYISNSIFENNLLEAGETFTFCQVLKSDNKLKNGLVVAEIQGNDSFFDFSQYDESILFKLPNSQNVKEVYMFGDIVEGNGLTETEAKSNIKNLVKNVALAGGYIFDTLGKSYNDTPNDRGYQDGTSKISAYKRAGILNTEENQGLDENNKKKYPLNMVPDYRYQFKKTTGTGGNDVFQEDTIINRGLQSDLERLIITDEDNDRKPLINYRSLSEYYTICMAFGLVDSVQKNMNIKTWTATDNPNGSNNQTTWYTAFYDMDTCLGINNAGKDVEYFAFSDYWDESENNNDNVLKDIIIYRDYSPSSSNNNLTLDNFFDTPSSYLFAVAKYSRILQILSQHSNDTADFPQELWARWRSLPNNSGDNTVGCLQNAKYFVENYFSNNLKQVPEILINLNYRNKYFIREGNTESSYESNNFIKFHGTRIAKVIDWLDGRLHILDAYFNLNKTKSPILYYKTDSNGIVSYEIKKLNDVDDEASKIYESNYESNYLLSNNPDIFILQDIFKKDSGSQTTLQGAGNINVFIKAKKLSPLYITIADTIQKYLIPEGGDNIYTLSIYAQMQLIQFLGSGAWTYLSNINSLPFTGNLIVNSKYLENLIGTSNNQTFTVSSDNIIMPNLKTLVLTGSKYFGTFTNWDDSDKFLNLNSVDISNSKLNLELRNSSCKEVRFNNVNSSYIKLIDCNLLELIEFSNLKLQTELYFNPYPITNTLITGNGLVIDGNEIKKLEIHGKDYTNNESKITISNDTELEELLIYNISRITISNCVKLRKITIIDSDENKDHTISLNINKCGSQATTFAVNTNDGKTIDLSNLTKLEQLTISEVHKFEKCIVNSNNLRLKSKDFYFNRNFKYLDTSDKDLFINNGNKLFAGDYNFTLKTGEEGNYCKLKIADTCTDISYIFSGYTNPDGSGSSGTKGKLVLDDVRYIFDNYITTNNKINNINYAFWGNRITINKDTSITSNNFKIDKLKYVSSAKRTFGYNNISFYTKELFNFGSDSSVTSINIDGFCQSETSYASNESVFAKLNYLDNIINKINILGQGNYFNVHNPFTTVITFVDDNKQTLSEVKVSDLFNNLNTNNNRLTSISGYTINNSIVDFDSAFEKLSNLTNVIYSFNKIDHNQKRYSLDKLFYYNSRLTILHYSFGGDTTKDSFANLYTMFDWNNSNNLIKNSTSEGVFLSRNSGDGFLYAEEYENINFTLKKYIFKEDYDKLVDYLLRNSSKGINTIFNSCTLILSKNPRENPKELILNFKYLNEELNPSINTNIRSFCNTFYRFKQVYLNSNDYNNKTNIKNYISSKIQERESNTEEDENPISITDDNYTDYSNEYLQDFFETIKDSYELPIVLDKDFFKYIPNVQYYYRAFAEIKLGSNLPLDFFKKRNKSKIDNIYFKDDNDEYHRGIYTYYIYNRNIINLYKIFHNVKWSKFISDNTNESEEYRMIRYNLLNSSEEIPYYSEPYSFNSSIFNEENYSDEIKELYYNRFESDDGELVKYEGALYNNIDDSEYNFSFSQNIKQNTEITDILKVINNENSGRLYEKTIYFEHEVSMSVYCYNTDLNNPSIAVKSLFTAPDLLYGCIESVSSTEDTSYTLKYLFSSEDNNWDTKLEGIMPDHFFKNCKKYPFNYAFQNIKLIPSYYTTINLVNEDDINIEEIICTFIPDNFTEVTNLSDGCFNFLIMLPPGDDKISGENKIIKTKFFIFSSKSLSRDTLSLKNSLPSIRGVENEKWWQNNNNESSNRIFTQSCPNVRYYNIMVTIKTAIENGETITIEEEGINLSKSNFDKLQVNGLITKEISAFLVGRVFTEETNNISYLKFDPNDNSNYLIIAFDTGSNTNGYKNVINKYFILPAASKIYTQADINNTKLIKIPVSDVGGLRLSMTENCSGDTYNFYKNYSDNETNISFN